MSFIISLEMPIELLKDFRLFSLVMAGFVFTMSFYVWRYYARKARIFHHQPHPKISHVYAISLSHLLMVTGAGVVAIHRFNNPDLSLALVFFTLSYPLSIYALVKILHFVHTHSKKERSDDEQ